MFVEVSLSNQCDSDKNGCGLDIWTAGICRFCEFMWGGVGSFGSAAVMVGELMQRKATASCSWHLEWAEKRAVG